MLECDFSAMISPKMFERFVLPDLERSTAAADHAFYHLDGPGAIRHLDPLLSLEHLRGIEWSPPPQKARVTDWIPLIKRIRDGGKRCLVRVDLDEARQVVREIGGEGLCLKIYRSPAQMSDEEAEDFLAVLASEDISRK
jgi:5-methyltetrahydrofolate--homocysteine methyltransferase